MLLHQVMHHLFALIASLQGGTLVCHGGAMSSLVDNVTNRKKILNGEEQPIKLH